MWSEHRFISFDETPIFYRVCAPEGKPRAVIVLVHGMGEHGGRYAHVAEYLAALGFLSAIPDLRGFGLSGGGRACVRRFSDFHEDIGALHRHLVDTSKDLPIFFLGHSFGGLISSSYCAWRSPKPRGLILSSPIFGIAVPLPAWRRWFGLACSYIAPNYSESTKVDVNRLFHDPQMMQRYREDKLIHQRISARLFRELSGAISRKNEIASRITVPTLVLQSGQDFVVSESAAVDFYHRLASQDKELEVYPDFYHEILNETDRERVLSRIGVWLTKHTP